MTPKDIIPYGLYVWHATAACHVVSLSCQLPGHTVTLGQRASMAGHDQLHPSTQDHETQG